MGKECAPRRRKPAIKFGVLQGKLTVPADFDAPLPPDIQCWFDESPECEEAS